MSEQKNKKIYYVLIGLIVIVFTISGSIVLIQFFKDLNTVNTIPVIYSINLNKIVNIEKKHITEEEIGDPNINPKIIRSRITKFIKYINIDASKIAGKYGVIIVKQAIVGGNIKDITAQVEQKLKKQGAL